MIIPFGFCQATLLFQGSGVPTGAAVTMGFDQGSTQTPLEVAQVVAGLWNDEISPIQVQNVDLVTVRVKFGPNTSGPAIDHPVTVGGDLTSAQAPPNVAMLVQKSTALGGKANRGRLYMPSIPEAEIDQGGNLSGTYFASAQAAWNAFLTGVETLIGPMVVLHNSSSDPTPVEALVVSSVAATQRRRLRR